jgi:hypothetical protein
MIRQLLKHEHGYDRRTVDVRFAESLKPRALAWARAGFDDRTAIPWIRARIAPAAAAYLARHRIAPEALDRRVPVSGDGDMILSVAIRAGRVSPERARQLLDADRPADPRCIESGRNDWTLPAARTRT